VLAFIDPACWTS
jgi:hypothetical protein